MKENILRIFEGMAEVLVVPEKFFQKTLEDKKPMNGLYFLIFFAALLGFMAGGLSSNFLVAIIFAVLLIVLAVIKTLIWAIISYLVAIFIFKGEGDFKNTFGLFGFISVSYLLGIFGLATLMLTGSVFSSFLLGLLMIIWMVVIAAVAVDAEHKIGIGKSFLSVMGIPALIIIVISLILGVL
ncbi:MAG: YIP1 family protein [Methanobacteriaceae archaeon]|nr:YIP1 family protein [Methanobacteriaceae archaeon]